MRMVAFLMQTVPFVCWELGYTGGQVCEISVCDGPLLHQVRGAVEGR